MALVFKRIHFYCKNKKTFLLSQADRKEIGKLVAELYHKQKWKIPLKKAKNKEPEGEFIVINYPTAFIPEIDRIIKEFVANISRQSKLTIEKSPEPVEVKRKRTRIPLNKCGYKY